MLEVTSKGKMILNFMVRRRLGFRISGMSGEFMVSTGNDRQLTMASASTINVLRVSSLS